VAATQHPEPANAAEALERLGRLPLGALSMEGLLQTVADLAKTVTPGNPEASVTLLVKDRPTTVATTGQLATNLDETQYERGHGPCLHAARTGELTEIADTRTDRRWRDYMPRAVERGILSSLSIPLAIDEEQQVTGGLNIHIREPARLRRGQRHGGHEARALRRGRRGQPARLPERPRYGRQPGDRPGGRAVIDQAKGILMERHKLTADQAFQLLAQASMRPTANCARSPTPSSAPANLPR
jgi:hypothetical protein